MTNKPLMQQLAEIGASKILVDQFIRDFVTEDTQWKSGTLDNRDKWTYRRPPKKAGQCSFETVVDALHGSRTDKDRAFGVSVSSANSPGYFVLRILGGINFARARSQTETYLEILDALGPAHLVLSVSKVISPHFLKPIPAESTDLDLVYLIEPANDFQTLAERVIDRLRDVGVYCVIGDDRDPVAAVRFLPTPPSLPFGCGRARPWELMLTGRRSQLIDPISMRPLASRSGDALRIIYAQGALPRPSIDAVLTRPSARPASLFPRLPTSQSWGTISAGPRYTTHEHRVIGAFAWRCRTAGLSPQVAAEQISSWIESFADASVTWQTSEHHDGATVFRIVDRLFSAWQLPEYPRGQYAPIQQPVSQYQYGDYRRYLLTPQDTLPLAELRLIQRIVPLVQRVNEKGKLRWVHDYDTEKQYFQLLCFFRKLGTNGVAMLHSNLLKTIEGINANNIRSVAQTWRKAGIAQLHTGANADYRMARQFERLLPAAPETHTGDEREVSYEDGVRMVYTEKEIRRYYSPKYAEIILNLPTKVNPGIIPAIAPAHSDSEVHGALDAAGGQPVEPAGLEASLSLSGGAAGDALSVPIEPIMMDRQGEG